MSENQAQMCLYDNIQKKYPKQPQASQTALCQSPQINRNTWILALVPQRDKNHLHHPRFWLNISYFHQVEIYLNGHCCLLVFHHLLSLVLLLCWAFLFSSLPNSCFLAEEEEKTALSCEGD